MVMKSQFTLVWVLQVIRRVSVIELKARYFDDAFGFDFIDRDPSIPCWISHWDDSVFYNEFDSVIVVSEQSLDQKIQIKIISRSGAWSIYNPFPFH